VKFREKAGTFFANHSLLILLFITIIVRFLFLWHFSPIAQQLWFDSDQGIYNGIALSLSQFSGFRIGGVPTAFVPPLYPFVLAIVYFLFKPNYYMALIIFQLILSLGTVYLIYELGQIIFKSRQIGLLAGYLVVANFSYNFVACFAWMETLYIFMLVLFFYYLCSQIGKIKTFNLKWDLILGTLFGLIILCRSVFLAYLAAFIIGLLYLCKNFYVAISQYLIILAVACLIFMPWIVRNYIVFERFIPVNAEMGYVFYSGNKNLYSSNQDKKLNTLIHTKEFAQADGQLAKEGVKGIFSQPAKLLNNFASKSFSFWGPLGGNISLRHQIAKTLIYLFVFLPSIIYFIYCLLFKGKREYVFFLLLLIVFGLVYPCFMVDDALRYRLPLEILFSIFGAAFYYNLFRVVLKR